MGEGGSDGEGAEQGAGGAGPIGFCLKSVSGNNDDVQQAEANATVSNERHIVQISKIIAKMSTFLQRIESLINNKVRT